MNRIWWVVLALAVSMFASAQNPVTWSVPRSGGTVRPGAKFTARVSAKIDPGWHIYSITQAPGGPVPTEVTIPAKQPFSLSGYVIGPLPHSSFDENFQIQTESYDKLATFKVPIAVDSMAPAGASAVAIDVRFQVCNERQCLPAKTVHLNMPLKITALPGRPR